MTDCKQFATFYLNDHFFGVHVLKVQEVIRYQQMTRVPIAPAMIQGLINLRGQIVTLAEKVAEPVGSWLEHRKRFDVGLRVRSVGAARGEGHADRVPCVLRCRFNGCRCPCCGSCRDLG